jgi:hypothetical protein
MSVGVVFPSQAASVYRYDFHMHTIGCDQTPAGDWTPQAVNRCDAKAYRLAIRATTDGQVSAEDVRSIRQRTRTGACVQFEDGTYGLASGPVILPPR